MIQLMPADFEPVARKVVTRLPSRFGDFTVYGYQSPSGSAEHLAACFGNLSDTDILVRLHSECLTGDVLGSQRCDCGEQLDLAMERIASHGRGVLVYLRQEGRGIGLIKKLQAYELQDQGYDTVEANLRLGFPADLRDYRHASMILADLGISRLRLLTNNPRKVAALQSHGLVVEARVPLVVEPNEHNQFYLRTKALRLGHIFS